MQNIAQHIERLLREQDCVIVKDLGGFIIQHQPARIVDNTLYPPMNEVGFNGLLTHEDGLLAQSLMQEREISFKEASLLIAAEVRHITDTLNAGALYLLGHIGTLKLNELGQIEFVPAAAHYLPENLALAPISLPAKLQPLEQTVEEPYKDADEIHITLSRHFIRSAAVAALVFVLSMFSPYHSESQRAGIWIPTWECDTMRMSYEEPVIEQEEMVIGDFQTAKAAVATTPQTATKKSAHIIIASLPTRQSAERYINELNCISGDTPTILEANGGTAFRVAIRSYPSSKEALEELEQIHRREGMSKAWLLGK